MKNKQIAEYLEDGIDLSGGVGVKETFKIASRAPFHAVIMETKALPIQQHIELLKRSTNLEYFLETRATAFSICQN